MYMIHTQAQAMITRNRSALDNDNNYAYHLVIFSSFDQFDGVFL